MMRNHCSSTNKIKGGGGGGIGIERGAIFSSCWNFRRGSLRGCHLEDGKYFTIQCKYWQAQTKDHASGVPSKFLTKVLKTLRTSYMDGSYHGMLGYRDNIRSDRDGSSNITLRYWKSQ